MGLTVPVVPVSSHSAGIVADAAGILVREGLRARPRGSRLPPVHPTSPRLDGTWTPGLLHVRERGGGLDPLSVPGPPVFPGPCISRARECLPQDGFFRDGICASPSPHAMHRGISGDYRPRIPPHAQNMGRSISHHHHLTCDPTPPYLHRQRPPKIAGSSQAGPAGPSRFLGPVRPIAACTDPPHSDHASLREDGSRRFVQPAAKPTLTRRSLPSRPLPPSRHLHPGRICLVSPRRRPSPPPGRESAPGPSSSGPPLPRRIRHRRASFACEMPSRPKRSARWSLIAILASVLLLGAFASGALMAIDMGTDTMKVSAPSSARPQPARPRATAGP